MKNKAMILTIGLVSIAMSYTSESLAQGSNSRTRSLRSDTTQNRMSGRRIASPQASRKFVNSPAQRIVAAPQRTVAQNTNTRNFRTMRADATVAAATTAVAPAGTAAISVPRGTLAVAPGGTLAVAPSGTLSAAPVSTTPTAENICGGRKGYDVKTTYISQPDPNNPGFTRSLPQFSCEPSDMRRKYPELYEACNGEPFNLEVQKSNLGCKLAWENSDLNTCGKKAKEADTAYNKFTQACADTQLGSVKKCMEEAKACVSSSSSTEDKAAEGTFDNSFWQSLGLGNSTNTFSRNSERVRQCSVYGLKDYETEKRERSRSLRDAQKEMADAQKDLAKEKKELADKKKEIQEDFVKMQADMRKDMTEEQQRMAEQGMDAQRQMMEVDQQKADLRSANITARSQSAKVTGERALALAELSDAMIHTKCMAELEAVIATMKKGMSSGAQNYLNAQQERKRRVQSVKELCYAKFEAIRAATYKDYRAQIDAVDNNVEENYRRIEALEQQKVSITKNQQEAITRAQESQKQANNELYQKMQAAQMQMQEVQASAQQAEMAANQNIQQAQQRINEVMADLRDLGKRPKGAKQPTEAAASFRDFANIVRAMEPSCSSEVESLKKKIEAEGLTSYYEKDLSSEDDDEDEGRD